MNRREARRIADKFAGGIADELADVVYALLDEPELDDDTAGRTEPETVDVYADQAEADWSSESYSDEELSAEVRTRLGRFPIG